MSENDSNAIDNIPGIIFASAKVKKELKGLPEQERDAFLIDLRMVAMGLDPLSDVDHLTSIAKGVVELKRNGSPAFRCVYTTKLPGGVVVLYAGEKTTNGQCRKLQKTVKVRHAAYKAETKA